MEQKRLKTKMAKKLRPDNEPTNASIARLIEYIEFLRKKFEREENYEVCIEMRDYINLFGDYMLGYNSFDDIEQELYDLMCADGEIDLIDERRNLVVFSHNETGLKFHFANIKFQEMCRLQLLYAAEQENKKKRK